MAKATTKPRRTRIKKYMKTSSAPARVQSFTLRMSRTVSRELKRYASLGNDPKVGKVIIGAPLRSQPR